MRCTFHSCASHTNTLPMMKPQAPRLGVLREGIMKMLPSKYSRLPMALRKKFQLQK